MAIGPFTTGNDNPVTQGRGDSFGLIESTGEPGFDRVGPLIDVERFKQEYLFGVPLESPLTGDVITDDTLKNFIRKGIGEFETSVRVPVNPIRIVDRFDFERADDLRFGTRRMTRWPVIKVEALKALWPGRNEALAALDKDGNPVGDDESQEIEYPTSWVTLLGDTGLIRIVPNSGSLVNADINFLASSAFRTVVLGGLKNWPNMWRVIYQAGFERDKVPEIVNDLVGVFSALKFLSMMGPAIFPVASQSIGIDGLAQSTATGGPQWLAQRVQELQAERDRLIDQLKGHYATDINLMPW
jgi:hypothetical protein